MTMSLGIKIESDFEDYYDCLGDNVNYRMVYKRIRDRESRGKSLNKLRELGIKTIGLKAARDFDYSTKEIVVYTDPYLHGSLGKKVMTIDEARLMYSNNLASKFYREANGKTIKILQVGTRRFRIYMKNMDTYNLSGGDVIKIEELFPSFNYSIMEPIFSIDYINSADEMIAIDYNQVQNLEILGIGSVMTEKEVMIEIKKALMAYNKL